MGDRTRYRRWAVAGLVVSVMLSLLALLLAAVMTLGLHQEITGPYRTLNGPTIALSAFFYTAAVMPFWTTSVFWRVLRKRDATQDDARLRRSARRAVIAILAVMAGLTVVEFAIVERQIPPGFFLLLAVQWGLALLPVLLLWRLMVIPSPIGREVSVADRF